MTLLDLEPQIFSEGTITQLPFIDFFANSKAQLPQVYQNAENMMATLSLISDQKQQLYLTILSLINVFNLNSIVSTNDSSPTGIYLEMLASCFNAPFTHGQEDYKIQNSIQNTVVFVNSRGYPSDFYNYFLYNGLNTYFTNANIQEDENATIFMNVPIVNTPLSPPNPFDIFVQNMNKLKGAGIDIIVSAQNIPFLQYGSLPTDVPPYEVAPGNAGLGVLLPDGQVIGGGFFSENTLIP